jgi:hypothetical protein
MISRTLLPAIVSALTVNELLPTHIISVLASYAVLRMLVVVVQLLVMLHDNLKIHTYESSNTINTA